MAHNIRPKLPTAKPYALLAILLAAGISVTAGAQQAAASGNESPAAQLKTAIDRDWVAKPGDFGSVIVTSPVYAMPFNQGCVIHQLSFLSDGGHASLGQMVANDLYFVFDGGETCASANPDLFFGIEPANDVSALLDFAKRLKDGPRAGKDAISEADRASIAPCFAPDTMITTRITRAHSWRHEGSGRDDRYQVVLQCKTIDEAGEIVALGVRDQDAISWELRPWGEATVELPPNTGGR